MAKVLGLTYVGGPTAIIDFGKLRLLTDPGFDPAGTEFRSGSYVLQRTAGPAISASAALPIDAVLLSHDHHFDNLDGAGRKLLPLAKRVVTTREGAARLDSNSIGLQPWETTVLESEEDRLNVTATPARHGPEGGDRGPVIGFVLQDPSKPQAATYISGDTVWYEGVVEVARRFAVRRALLFMGAARVDAVGPHHLTLTAAEAVKVAQAMPYAVIVPLHFEGWKHFSEGRDVIEQTFAVAGLSTRLLWGEPGKRIELP